MTKEHHQLDSSVSAASAQSRPASTDSVTEHTDSTLLVLSLRHATVQIESGPMFTKLSVNGHWYHFDHITGRLLQEGVV